MRKLTCVSAATLAALALTTATPGFAQVGGPAAQPGAPQPGTSEGASGRIGAEDSAARKQEDRVGGGRRWYRSDTDRGDTNPRMFDDDARFGERGEFGRRRYSQERDWGDETRGGQGFRDDRWGDRDRYDGRRADREAFHRFGRGDREDLGGGPPWRDRDVEPWRPGPQGFDRPDGGRGAAQDRRAGAGAMAGPPDLMRVCGPGGERMLGRMLDRLERLTAPSDAQRASFDKLVDAAEKARDAARSACPAGDPPLTLPGRLAEAEKRLTSLLDAVRTLRPALDEFYASLSEEQKARLYMPPWARRSSDASGAGRIDERGMRGPGRAQGGERGLRLRDGGPSGDDTGQDYDRDGWLDEWRGPS